MRGCLVIKRGLSGPGPLRGLIVGPAFEFYEKSLYSSSKSPSPLI